MPKLVYLSDLGAVFDNRFGALGPEKYVTGHWTAGPIPDGDAAEIKLILQFHRMHKEKGWGGLGYHAFILRSGTIVFCRPPALKGAHVGGHNSCNYGISMHGGGPSDPRPGVTAKQRSSMRWLAANAHTTKVRRGYRTDRRLKDATWKGHNDWPGHTSNACPGTFKATYRKKGVRP